MSQRPVVVAARVHGSACAAHKPPQRCALVHHTGLQLAQGSPSALTLTRPSKAGQPQATVGVMIDGLLVLWNLWCQRLQPGEALAVIRRTKRSVDWRFAAFECNYTNSTSTKSWCI
jgi:hypothetical protein